MSVRYGEITSKTVAAMIAAVVAAVECRNDHAVYCICAIVTTTRKFSASYN